ncbi:hypothetical protein BDV96DRAFT_606837 [Lophiotrema nucula]|uniref:Uncharacterized protein n=1 Tax=Lophiotrema nucula TaxID=690887 RepID=A0A6A5YIW3_9PLEO|nr:hypothetical protein BDV96DRAFT_606837 [Lophiotrema nucula]
MPLLALPLELLQQIFKYAAYDNQPGLAAFLRLRYVNVLFSVEIVRACVRTRALLQPPTQHSDGLPLTGPWLSQANSAFLAMYLYLSPPGSDRVNAIVDALKGIKSYDEHEDEHDKRWGLFSELSKHMDQETVVEDLGLVEEVDGLNLLAAAIYVGVPDNAIRDLVDKYKLDMESRSRYWGFPLVAAVETGKIELLEFLLEGGADVNPDVSIFKDVASTLNGEVIDRHLLNPKYQFMLPWHEASTWRAGSRMSTNYQHTYEDAVLIAFGESEAKTHEDAYFLTHIPRVAAESDILGSFEDQLALGTATEELASNLQCFIGLPGPLEIAARLGYEQVVRYFIDHDKPYDKCCAPVQRRCMRCNTMASALKACVWEGRARVVQMLLDADGRLSYDEWAEMFNIA